jgi:hypothetical protein
MDENIPLLTNLAQYLVRACESLKSMKTNKLYISLFLFLTILFSKSQVNTPCVNDGFENVSTGTYTSVPGGHCLQEIIQAILCPATV